MFNDEIKMAALPAFSFGMNVMRSSFSSFSKYSCKINASFNSLSKDYFLNHVRHFSQTATQTTTKSKRSWKGSIATVLGLGMVVGGGYSAYESYAAPSRSRYAEPANVDSIDSTEKNIFKSLPTTAKPSRNMSGPTDFLGLELMLFQYQSCPFCCKVRAFLDYYGIPYNIVEVNPVSRSQTKFTKYGKVPILLAKDSTGIYHQLNDSSAIVSILATFLLDMNGDLSHLMSKYQSITYKDEKTGKDVTQVMNRYFLMYDNIKISEKKYKELEEERKWRIWVDDHLVHTISPNIYRSWDEALETFNQFSINGGWEKTFSTIERKIIINVGACAMYFIGKRLQKKYHLKDDVRESLYDAANDWVNTVGNNSFKGGSHPNLADLAVFGVLNSFEGCRAFQDLFQRNAKFKEWYLAVKSNINAHSGSVLISKHNVKKIKLETLV